MSLRFKLVISFTVLLLFAIAAVGIVASQSIRRIMVAQTDRTLVTFDRDPRPSPGPGGGFDDRGEFDREPFYRSIAEVFVGPDGDVVFSEPSGFADAPDPLPAVTGLGDTTGFVDLDSVDGSISYRAYVQPFPDGGYVVRAAPLTDVTNAQNELIRTLVLAGLGVLLVGGSVTWWMVSRAMRPVDEMVETAEAIAHGDLSRRVPEADANTELGRLGGSLNEMLGTIEDAIESERDGRERLRQFVADASHELRTPLTTIGGYAELRRRGGLNDPRDEDRAWSRVDAESQRMRRLVEDLLTLARLGQTMPLDLSQVDVAAVCRDAAADFAAKDPDRPIELTGVDSVVITGDAERLHQVVANLLGNVTMHTPEGTEVTVELETTSEGARLTVSDTGPGIPDEAVDHVLDRFYRADPSRSRRSGGAGLGLSIADAIVEAHGGTLRVDNGESGGAVFTIELASEPPTHGHRDTEERSQVALRSGSYN